MAGTLSIIRCFETLRDPRSSNRDKTHKFLDIIAIALCATIAGAKDWPQVVTFAQGRRDWLATFLDLSNGIPSRSTFERVFAALSPRGLQRCILLWINSCTRGLGLGHISIDGKTLRGSGNDTKGLKNLHLVSAWSDEAKLSLGQVAVDDKSNEITAIPQLLRMLNLKGALVTIDAMGTQKAIAKQVVDAGGDYVLPVKENQPNLLQDIRESFLAAFDANLAGFDYDQYETENRGHGRQEKRSVTVLYTTERIRSEELWEGLKAIGMCVRERVVDGKTSEEVCWFIGSRKMSAKQYGEALRNHWGIENKLHWQLDVTFREDESRIQDRNSAENMALLRKVALGLLKQDPGKISIANKQFKASLETTYLEKILQMSK
jgi:predicted transposase YbfD/YdcC